MNIREVIEAAIEHAQGTPAHDIYSLERRSRRKPAQAGPGLWDLCV